MSAVDYARGATTDIVTQALRYESGRGLSFARGPNPPDDQSATHGACLLWIRRQGWGARVEPWMIQWVMDGRS